MNPNIVLTSCIECPSAPQHEQLAAVTAIITTEMQSVMIAVCTVPGCLLRNINRCESPVSHPSSPGARAAPANEGQIGENQFNETRAVSSKTGSEPTLPRLLAGHGARHRDVCRVSESNLDPELALTISSHRKATLPTRLGRQGI